MEGDRRLKLVMLIALAVAAVAMLTACVTVKSGDGPGVQATPTGEEGSRVSGTMGWEIMGPGMMGPGRMGGPYNPNAEPITIDDAADAARRYLASYGGDLALAEVMEFAWNFYAEVEEKETSVHAMELLIDKYTGHVYPEMGPNMMWNTKYGMMGGMMGGYYQRSAQPSSDMPIGLEQAKSLAQQFLDANMPGVTVADADTFYGYYTLHTLKDGAVEGMLSVNGYNGQVWYHTWHGPFVQMQEFEGEAHR